MTFGNGIKTAVEAFFQTEGKMNVDGYLCVIGQIISNHIILPVPAAVTLPTPPKQPWATQEGRRASGTNRGQNVEIACIQF